MDLAYEIAYKFGFVLALLFGLVWLPLAGWMVGSAFGHSLQRLWTDLLPYNPKKKPKPQKDPVPPGETRKKHLKTKPSKYAVVEEYEDEYKITNPVDFNP